VRRHNNAPLTVYACTWIGQFFSRQREKAAAHTNLKSNKPILSQDELFHPLIASPFADLRERATFYADHSVCPTCVADAGISDGTSLEAHRASKRPGYTCPECGFPTHCSHEHWERDLEEHRKVCSLLRQVNEDEHDLRSGRRLLEFEYPGPQGFEEAVNMSNWDTFFYTRNFPSLNSERSVRHASKPLTYPITIASILHETSPYRPGRELTNEGIKSLTALRTTLSAENTNRDLARGRFVRPLRIIMPGARAESQLPVEAWMQLLYLFPSTVFHIHFIGPHVRPPPALVEKHAAEAEKRSDEVTDTSGQVYRRPVSLTPTPNLSLHWHDMRYTALLHQNLAPFDPYRDVFFFFCPGFGYPTQRAGWHDALRMIIRTQCAIFATGFDAEDIQRDTSVLTEDHEEEMDWLMSPTLNRFRSLKPDVNPQDVRRHIYTNWSVYGFRGKRYEVRRSHEDEDE
jgi:splicing suppressor protein 51